MVNNKIEETIFVINKLRKEDISENF